MSTIQDVRAFLGRWLNDSAESVVAAFDWFSTPRPLRLIERDNGRWVLEDVSAGKRGNVRAAELKFADGQFQGAAAEAFRGRSVNLVARPDRFLFKPLELPSRATEFLGGIVRTQIDRLTPWAANEAAFGFTQPKDAGEGRIVVTVAATARTMVTPFVRALTQQGVRSLTITTAQPSGTGPGITVVEEKLAGMDVRAVRRAMTALLALTLTAAVGVVAFAVHAAGSLQARQDEVASRIARQHSALMAAQNAQSDPLLAAKDALAKRKNQSPAAVIVLEALTRVLPDNTYVTEMRIEGDKLQVTGITADAPSLIRLIEQSPNFTRAVFFAPTTREPSDPGYRFHIEARIVPVFSLPS